MNACIHTETLSVSILPTADDTVSMPVIAWEYFHEAGVWHQQRVL